MMLMSDAQILTIISSPKIQWGSKSGAHHALAEIVWVDARQRPHEQGQHVSGPLRKALPT